MTAELDTLDRRVAELRGWKWQEPGYAGCSIETNKRTGLLYLDGVHQFEPTRDARQAMVLLTELPDAYLSHSFPQIWTCGVRGDDSHQHGDTPLIAIVRAYIAYREAQS